MDYDQFESTMQAAGWSLDEIEAAWQDYLLEQRIEAEEVAHLNSLPAPDECDSLVNSA